MTGKELEQTRVYSVRDFPPGTKMLVGDRRDLDAALATGQVRAVGKFNQLSGGATSVPVVYVSRRAQSWPERHRKALIIAGSALLLLAGLGFAIAWVGPWWFLGGVFAMAVAVALISRLAHGGQTSVSVTTTTKVRVR